MSIKSPEVHSDRTVTFRYKDANAKKVEFFLEGTSGNVPMTRGDDGVWTITVGPLDPERYGYRFFVDGVKQMDPNDPDIRPNLQNPSNVAYVRGTPPKLWDRTDVPHGELHEHLYFSKLANDDRDLWVYTPPAYDPKRAEKYPVLYLLHGYSDDAGGWINAGNANLILDNMIAQGQIKPMVVVMPTAYGTMEMIKRGWSVWTGKREVPLKNQEMFTDQLIHEILPMVESRYDIAHDAAHRAIAGLSMGGGETLFTGLNNPDVFGYVAAMSSAILTDDPETFYAGYKKTPLKMFWTSCGTEDGLITANRKLGVWAKEHVKARVVSVNETPGMHTWLVWRENLITIAPMLFAK